MSVFVNGYGVRAVHDAAVYTTGKNAVSAVLLLALTALWARRRPLGVIRPVGRQ